MNGRGDQNHSSRPVEINDCAADWLWRQQSDDWSEADHAALNDWLAQSRHHLVAYWRLKAAWERAERLAALRSGPMRQTSPAAPPHSWRKLRIAAAVCAIGALAAAGFYRWGTQEDRYETAVGQRDTIKLADGSLVDLNTNSAISIRTGIWGRKASLSKGEAFFRIRHDVQHPFTVLAARHRITDLGTAFAVRTSGAQVQVTLVEGRARLEAFGSGIRHRAAELTPGEVAVATADSISVSRIPARAISNSLAWRQGKLVFNHVTLAEAAAEFNRYNGKKLFVESSAANLKISGTFDAGSVGPFTNMARLAFGLQIKQRDHGVVVSRETVKPAGQRD